MSLTSLPIVPLARSGSDSELPPYVPRDRLDSEHSESSLSDSISSLFDDSVPNLGSVIDEIAHFCPTTFPPTITPESFAKQVEQCELAKTPKAIFICTCRLRAFCDGQIRANEAIRHLACKHSICQNQQGFLQKEAVNVGLLSKSGEFLGEGYKNQLEQHVKAAQGIKLTSLYSLRLVKNMAQDEFRDLLSSSKNSYYLSATFKR
eukprot:gb/GEZN01011973.1/.p1 GENE.gb/GEZN01011973.1/~~gb/GEZN01011973.1/.p1  ORF type:complete len:205 (+),score=32.01 gb/GEZN01011973.1/:63-677(+)